MNTYYNFIHLMQVRILRMTHSARCVFSAVIAITMPLEAWTLLRATQIDSPAIQKRADISAHKRVNRKWPGAYFRLRTWRVKEENVRRSRSGSKSTRKRRDTSNFRSHKTLAIMAASRAAVFVNCTVAGAIAVNVIHSASHSRLTFSHRPSV